MKSADKIIELLGDNLKKPTNCKCWLPFRESDNWRHHEIAGDHKELRKTANHFYILTLAARPQDN